jgi:hypothetical protein
MSNKKSPNRELNITLGVNEDDEVVYQELNSVREIRERSDFDRISFLDLHNYKIIPYRNGEIGVYNRESEGYVFGDYKFESWSEAVDALMDMEDSFQEEILNNHLDLTIFKF